VISTVARPKPEYLANALWCAATALLASIRSIDLLPFLKFISIMYVMFSPFLPASGRLIPKCHRQNGQKHTADDDRQKPHDDTNNLALAAVAVLDPVRRSMYLHDAGRDA
jgi:hypothetical protein